MKLSVVNKLMEFAVAGGAAWTSGALLEFVIKGGDLLAAVEDSRKQTCEAVLANVRKAVEKSYDDAMAMGRASSDAANVEAAFAQLDDALAAIKPTLSDIAEADFDAAKLLSARMTVLPKDSIFRQSHTAREILDKLFTTSWRLIRAMPEFHAELSSLADERILARLAALKQQGATILDAVERTDLENRRQHALRAKEAKRIEALLAEFKDQLERQGIQLVKAEAALAKAQVTDGLARSLLRVILGREIGDPEQFPGAFMEAMEAWVRANPDRDRAFTGNLFPALEGLRREAREAYEANQIERFHDLRHRIRIESDRAYRDLAEQAEAGRAVVVEDVKMEIESGMAARNAKGVAAAIARQTELGLAPGASLFDALRAAQDEWYERGRDKGLNFDLEVSIELARLCVDRSANMDQRGAALIDLGVSLQTLGEREGGTERLEQAVKVYHAALEEWPRDRVPLDWAITQTNLGSALQTLGERENGTARLDEAVTAFRAALQERTRERVPLDWAMTQNNLGNALLTLGQRENGTALLDEAVKAYRAALEEWTRDRVPLHWAAAQNNLGSALKANGERESGMERLEQAVTAYGAALEERTRDRVPLDWAFSQHNMAGALLELHRRGKAGVIAEALSAVRGAVEVFREAGADYYLGVAQDRLEDIEAEIAKAAPAG